MTLPPQFWIKVLGITSKASAIALYGAPATPGSNLAFSLNETEMAISVAPPPGARIGLKTTFRATDMASARFRSISFKMSFDGPRKRIVHAFGDLHSSKNEKYLNVSLIDTREEESSLVTELFNVEHATFCSDVCIPQVLNSVDDGSSDSSSDSVVVGLSDTT
jgi:hypothetical protein